MELSLKVLVVEDELLVRDLLEEALTDGGFTVATASSGAEALKMLEAPDSSFRALVTDVQMPPGTLTGWEVAKRARELNSELPVVYMSGAAGSDWASNGVPNSVFVPKPFAAAQVVTAVAQLLNQGNTPGA